MIQKIFNFQFSIFNFKKGLALRRSSDEGFTLIELIIVMAIIAIMASVGIGTYTSTQRKGWDAQRVENLSGIRQALEMYYNDYGKYPQASGGKILSCAGAACNWGGGPMNDPNGTIYMRVVPKDPRDPLRTYYYTAAADQSWFKIYGCIENNQDPRRTVGGVAGTNCGSCIETTATLCNYGISSPNTTP